jgi:hypothetical protein
MTYRKLKYLSILGIIGLAIACTHEPAEGPITDGGNGGGNGGGGGGGTLQPCDPDTIYFSQTILPLLTSSCAIPGCHDPGTAEDGVILNSYENIMNTAGVNPGDPNGSDLYEAITDDDEDDRMPPADQFPTLSAEEINLIRTWILQGAKNNTCAAECDTLNVTYALSIQPLISSKCQGCHSGANPQGGISLTNYAQISGEALFGTMLDAVSHTGSATPMPYNSAQLPQCEIDLIRIWIENGAPE